ncbi:flavodoxin-like fold domain protein, putative NAD(P)H (quinone) dehydrogenase/reductase [Campylobacter iguaniorum]|uniref:Flavodoxin-like fold domain protein, putative NAD(P)H (Quinone) dehydrogenase/reductase n=1 Tax=Campylobacter iguaniorum TaxID=1244531 RepID=A0A076FC06_9BACT|nr:NAD(P)H-dependent oxidoreductase [Campylobacter iguaniorum]AII15476.1 flavodoxin-like fold domain protein, putative NAD(P)H (quinone) dehydrogenase/reductase [Campylobacter iguaniorum]ALV25407.1 flavodoxin-like fold domain protein, putative NAD(P)H (quinone) dehydrogenase/reductase [Campylobacter iguaniorum]
MKKTAALGALISFGGINSLFANQKDVSMQDKILIISGHTNLQNDSVANKNIIANLKELLPSSTVLDLGSMDYKFDVKRDQQLLLDHDIIVMQFPLFWYSWPSSMQKWVEDVFTHGFSHGSSGNKLKGKKILFSLTTGAGEEAYNKNGFMKHEISEFLYPMDAVANLAQMQNLGFICTYGVSYSMRSSKKSEIQNKAKEHAKRVAEALQGSKFRQNSSQI